MTINYFHDTFIFLFEIINFVPEPWISFWISASVSDAVAVNPNGIKILLTNALSTFSLLVISVLEMVLELCQEILMISPSPF